MTYEESYMKCNNLDELLEEVNSDVVTAKLIVRCVTLACGRYNMNELAQLDAIWAYETEIKHMEYYPSYYEEEEEDEECE